MERVREGMGREERERKINEGEESRSKKHTLFSVVAPP